MADGKFTVAKQGDKFRVMRAGKPQASVDKGGYKTKQRALDAAMQANRENRKIGTGGADQARADIANRGNRIDKALSRATGN